MGSSLVDVRLLSAVLSAASLPDDFSDARLGVADRDREMLVGSGAFPSLERSTKLVVVLFLLSGNSRDSVIPVVPTGVLLEVDLSSRLGEALVIGAAGFEGLLELGRFVGDPAARDALLFGSGWTILSADEIGAGTFFVWFPLGSVVNGGGVGKVVNLRSSSTLSGLRLRDVLERLLENGSTLALGARVRDVGAFVVGDAGALSAEPTSSPSISPIADRVGADSFEAASPSAVSSSVGTPARSRAIVSILVMFRAYSSSISMLVAPKS
jgi:hypothetical protein